MSGRTKAAWLFSPSTSLVLYGLLMIACPFLMMRKNLQRAIRNFSHLSFDIGTISIPYVVAAAVILAIVLLVCYRRKLTRGRILASLFVLLMMYVGQKSTDYYIGFDFYDLQNNWHYFAYAGFAYMVYRVLKPRELPPARIILYAFGAGMLFLAAFDEMFQVFMSGRYFDMADIAKNVWGIVMGIIVVYFVVEKGEIAQEGWRIRQQKIPDYWKKPIPLIFLQAVFAYIMLVIGSVLGEMEYWWLVIVLTIVAFLAFFLILHLSGKDGWRTILAVAGAALLGIQALSFIRHCGDNIVYNRPRLTVYKGIPLPYFDIMIHSNGGFRLVDKKKHFSGKDLRTIYKHAPDILLIGSGSNGDGGFGFPERKEVQFAFNPETRRPLQIIILKTPDACTEFNRLKEEGRRVTFVIHNS